MTLLLRSPAWRRCCYSGEKVLLRQCLVPDDQICQDEDILSDEDDEDLGYGEDDDSGHEKVDDGKHARMLHDITGIPTEAFEGRKRKRTAVSEAYPESKFNPSRDVLSGNGQISIQDLLDPLRGAPSYNKLRKRIEHVEKKGESVHAPLPIVITPTIDLYYDYRIIGVVNFVWNLWLYRIFCSFSVLRIVDGLPKFVKSLSFIITIFLYTLSSQLLPYYLNDDILFCRLYRRLTPLWGRQIS